MKDLTVESSFRNESTTPRNSFSRKSTWPGIVQDVDELLRGQPHIQRKEHGTGFENTVVSFEQADGNSC